MKKYVKPDLYFEDFEMSVGVAACGATLDRSTGKLKNPDAAPIEYRLAEQAGVFTDGFCTLSPEAVESFGYFGGSSDFTAGLFYS